MVERRGMVHGQPRADRLVVCISDVEMGAGGVLDDFADEQLLVDVLASYAAPPFDELAVDVVFNGDTFDFLKTAIDGRYPVHIGAVDALAKFERIHAAHQPFFEAVRSLLAGDHRRVFFTVGNHDQELLFPEVQRAIRAALGDAEGVSFPGLSLSIGDALIEHGSQADSMFRVPPEAPFLEVGGRTILNLPWGSVALLEATMPLQPHLYWADRLKPRDRIFRHLPELREVLVNAFWQYWTRDYWRSFMAGDPLKTVSWTMVKEIAYRFGYQDLDVGDLGVHQQRLVADERWRVRCIGHHHRPTWWAFADRKLLVTGCYRNEFPVGADGSVGACLPKVHAEIYQRRGRTVRSHLVEWDGPPVPAGWALTHVSDRRAAVLALLGTEAERVASGAAQAEQEAQEAAAGRRSS